jgi:arsenate reductase
MTTIYHNPRCSKSRQTLALLQENGITPTIVEYLQTPPTTTELADILQKLGKAPADIIRKKEAKEEGVDLTADDATLLAAMATTPRIIERPIVVHGARAVLGRPPENVLDLIQ